jgi:hypothetical protein
MICDRCGRRFPSHQGTHDVRGSRAGDADPRIEQITICPACAAGRGATLMFYVYFFVALLIGIVAISVLAQCF